MSCSKLRLPLLIALLAAGCAAQSGVKPTNLSEIRIGAPRAKVVAALGEPLGRANTEYGLTEAYTYDKGTDPALPRSYRGCVGGCAMAHMVILLLSPLAHKSIVEDQKGRLLIVYDENERAKKIYRGKMSGLSDVKPGASRKFVELLLGEPSKQGEEKSANVATYAYKGEDAETQGETLTGQIKVTYNKNSKVEKIDVITPQELERRRRAKREKERMERVRSKAEAGDPEAQYEMWHPSEQNDRWLCLAAHNGHSSAQVQLGDRYWAGKSGYRQNRPLGFMWFSLSARKDNIRGKFEVAEKRPILKPQEMASAEKLIAEWKPHPKSCGADSSALSLKNDGPQ